MVKLRRINAVTKQVSVYLSQNKCSFIIGARGVNIFVLFVSVCLTSREVIRLYHHRRRFFKLLIVPKGHDILYVRTLREKISRCNKCLRQRIKNNYINTAEEGVLKPQIINQRKL